MFPVSVYPCLSGCAFLRKLLGCLVNLRLRQNSLQLKWEELYAFHPFIFMRLNSSLCLNLHMTFSIWIIATCNHTIYNTFHPYFSSVAYLPPLQLMGNWVVTGRISQFSSKKKNTCRHIAEVTPNKLVVRLAYGDSGIRRPFSEAAQKIAHFFHEDEDKEPDSGADIFIFKLPYHLQWGLEKLLRHSQVQGFPSVTREDNLLL